MATVVRLLYAQRWKDLQLPTKEKWMVKLMALTEIEKLTTLIKGEILISFVSTWKPFWDFVLEMERSDLFDY